eukprot:symbB.v1.2.011473.t1/scaffold770.1/size163962/9
MQMRYRTLNDAVCRAALHCSSKYGAQEIGSLVWCFAILRVIDIEVLLALSKQIPSTVDNLGTRELGVLVDTLPVLRPQLLPSLQSRAFMGAVELQKTPPNLANLETITFGVLGTCELLKHISIVAHSTPSPKTLKISRGGKGGALPYKQVTCLLHYNISALGQGTLQRSTGEGSPWSPSLSPTSGIARLDRVDRSACAEFRALEALDAMLTEQGPQGTEGAEGTMMFSVTEPPCVSCLGRLIRFSAKYPKINVEAWIDGSLWRFGLEVGRFQSLAETQKNSLEAMAANQDDMDPGEKCIFLLKKCIKVLDTYEPRKTTVDAYMQDCECLKDKKIGDQALKFIHQVFYGCCRYQKFLKMFVTSFMYKCPATALRAEQTLYIVIAYLLFFRLEELTVPQFREFLACGYGTPPALLALMQYALNVEELEKWVKVEWCKVYDVDYIEQDVIGKLQSFRDQLKSVVDEVEYKATGTIKAADGTSLGLATEKKRTEFKPFNLTQPRPRLIPEPDVITREVKAQPVPTSIHKNSLNKVEEQKKKRMEEEKAKVLSKYSDADHFSLETSARRDHEAVMEDLKKKVESEQMAECTFYPKTAKKFVAPSGDATVRHNASSVLREDALLKQKQAKEYQILKRYQEDLHDASQFYTWQERMKEQDQSEEEARVRQRAVEMQMSRESAMEAYESSIRRKHILAEHQREELQFGLQMKEKEKEWELGEKKLLVEETKEAQLDAERPTMRNRTKVVKLLFHCFIVFHSISIVLMPPNRQISVAPCAEVRRLTMRRTRRSDRSASPPPTSSWSTRAFRPEPGTGSVQLGRGRLDASPAPRKNSRAHTVQPSRSRPPSADPAGRVVGKPTHALAKWRQLPREEPGSWVPPPLEAQLEAIGLAHDDNAAKILAEGSQELELEMTEVYPEKHRSSVEMRKLQRILQPLSPLFLPQLPPIPDTWLFDSKEAPQSFQDYVMERPPAPQRAHNRIYLLPLTEAGGGHDKVGSLPDLRPLQRFIEAFFDLTCKVLPYDPLLTGKGIASRSNGHGNDLQYHAKDSLRQLRIRLPMDGFCILGVTMCDLFDSTHSFVHSSVSVKDRTGILSFCRLDPAWYRVSCHMDLEVMRMMEGHSVERREGDVETLQRRAHGIISHNLCQFFGMANCQFYICRMQGSSGLHESDTNQDKVDLCPVCLRKLSWNLACGTHEAAPTDLSAWCVQRYRRLLSYAEKLGPVLQAYKLWLRSRLAQLDFNILPAAAAAVATRAMVPSEAKEDCLEEEVEVDQPVQLTPDSRAKHEAELLMLFSRHDEDGDGKMKVREFCRLISSVDEAFSAISAMKMFEAADINGDGSVDVKEFLSWLLLPDDPGEDEVRIIRKLQADSHATATADNELDFLPAHL